MSIAVLFALSVSVAATVAFALSDNLNAVAAIWIVALGLLTFGCCRAGQAYRFRKEFDDER